MKGKLYVIIVTFNGAKWIERCLNSVKQSSINAIPIVVDNGSTDNTLSLVKELFPETILLCSGGNVGFGKGNNIGIQYAMNNGADYVYLLNQDAWVDSNVFETILEQMECYPKYAIVSPIQITANRDKVDSNFMNYVVNDLSCPMLKEDLLLNRQKGIYEIEAVMAAHWMLRLSAVKEVGMFSDAFPHYGEDNNLINRLHYFGYKVGLCPGVFAVHDRETRERTPEQLVHILYIHVIRHFHNIEEHGFFYTWGFLLKNMVKILLVPSVSLKQKFKILVQVIKVPISSYKYKAIYLKGGWELQ